MKPVFLTFLIFLTLLAASLHAQDVSFNASVDPQRFPLGASAQLTVTVKGTRQDLPTPSIPLIEGLQIKSSGSFVNSITVNGKSSVSRNFLYSIFPSKVGTFQIPALTVTIDGANYSTEPISIEVTAEPLTNSTHQPGASATDLQEKIFLVTSAPKMDVYLNEPLAVSIKLYVNGLNVRDIQMRDLSQEGFQKINSFKAKQYQQIIEGVSYDVVEFTATMYPLQEGELSLGPARLACSIIYETSSQVTDDPFFGNIFKSYDARPMELSSKPLAIKVLPLPSEGKPKNFSGAVGQFNFEASVGPQEVKVGDPLTLKMKISGQGNMKAVEFPEFLDSRFKTYDPQIKQDESLKTFEGVIIPTSDQIKEVPAIEFSYFDPAILKYKTILQGPFPVAVKPADKEEQFKAVAFSKPVEEKVEEQLGRDLIFIKEDMGRLTRVGGFIFNHWAFWLVGLVYLGGMTGLIVFYQIKYRMKTDTGFARRIKAPRQAKKAILQAQKLLGLGDVKEFYATVDKTLRDYLGNKLHKPPASLSFDVIQKLLVKKAIGPEYLNSIGEILERAQLVRFASLSVEGHVMEDDLRKLQALIEYLEDEL